MVDTLHEISLIINGEKMVSLLNPTEMKKHLSHEHFCLRVKALIR